MNISSLIRVARGDAPADLLLKNVKIINVFTGEIIPGSIAVFEGHIAGIGDYEAKWIADVGGLYAAPGFIDAHVHIESAMTSVSEFARSVMKFGTTTVIADPHEIANVLGQEGIRYMLQSAENQPINIFFTLPSCVPATDLETSGAKLGPDDLLPFLSENRIVGLAEMMNFPGVIHQPATEFQFGIPQNTPKSEILHKLSITQKHRKRIDGHAPGLKGKDLFAYAAAGIASDHECTTIAEAIEKLRCGIHVMIREGTAAKNLKQLLPAVNVISSRRMMWCTDDRHLQDICTQGHIDMMIREAIRSGIDPITAIRMGTLNPAEYFGLHYFGAITPGRVADFVLFSELENLRIEQVYCHGKLCVSNGQIPDDIEKPAQIPIRSTMNVDLDAVNLAVPIPDFAVNPGSEEINIRVIEIIPEQIITRSIVMPATLSDGYVVSNPVVDILKIAVVERHHRTGNIGIGFVKGFGLCSGAIASSVAHDSHNIIVVGINDDDMRIAIECVADMGGGLAVVSNGKVAASVPLPIAGLMSELPVKEINTQIATALNSAYDLCSIPDDPFMQLSFLALPVIPELKISDMGLIQDFKIVPLFVDSN